MRECADGLERIYGRDIREDVNSPLQHPIVALGEFYKFF